MIKFEKMLLEQGYLRFSLDCKTLTYHPAPKHIVSSMYNLDHRYFHESDTVILEKIAKGLSLQNGITWEDRKHEIIVGLSEKGKPPTLIHPLPVIVCSDHSKTQDDRVNSVLERYTPEQVLHAIHWSKTIKLYI